MRGDAIPDTEAAKPPRKRPLRGRAALWAAIGIAIVAIVVARVARRSRGAADPAREVSVVLSPIDGVSVAARVQVEAPGAARVVVRHGSDRAYKDGTRTLVVPTSGRVSTPVLGLLPAQVTYFEVTAHYPGGDVRTRRDLTLAMPPLPPGVPGQLRIAENTGTATGVVLMSMNGGEDVGGLATILDRTGRVLWYRRCGGGAYAFDRLPNGRLILHQFESQTFEEVELDGTVVRRWTDPKSVSGADGHDFQMLANGNALFFGAEAREVDSRQFFADGVPRAQRWDDTVSEIAPSGMVVWRWSSWGRFTESDLTVDPRDPIVPSDYEVAHMNSIDPQPDGSVILSLRNVSTVAKIAPGGGDVSWRLGGKRSDFRIEGDPLGGFHRQHDARIVGPGRLLLFDNGNLHSPPESRAVEYALDESTKTARMVWQFRRSPPLFAPIAGSAQRLPNGNTVISWGPLGAVTEVDASGKLVWEVRTAHFGVYRARAVSTPFP